MNSKVDVLAHMEKNAPSVEQARAALIEFTALRAEIAYRTTAQYTLVVIALVAVSTLGGLALGPEHVNPSVLLIVSPVCTATGLFWLDNAHAIYQIGDYVKKELWLFIRTCLDPVPPGNKFSSIPIVGLTELPNYEFYALAGKQLSIERGVLLFPFGLIFVFAPAVSTFIVVRLGHQPWVYVAAAVDALLILSLLLVWILFLTRVLRAG